MAYPSANLLAEWKTDFPKAIELIEEARRDEAASRVRLAQVDTPLSIGVMGQVKAGKSSFLNSLLFAGRPLLPEAVTPKTANLTRICYAEKPRFTAHFYMPEDWALIERQAQQGRHAGADDISRSAYELVETARKNNRDIPRILAQGAFTHEASDLDQLAGVLNDYVGSDGRMTPLVVETVLALPIPELMGIDIVDTPGMNDVVLSRTEKTRKYMAKCDVVFFLSRASQFMDENDQQLLARQLPQKGVKRLILVGSQFDMTLLDDGFNRKSYEEAVTRLTNTLTQQAQRNLDKLLAQRQAPGTGHFAGLLKQMQTPVFASTYAWLIANQKRQDWCSGVQHAHQELCEMAAKTWRTPMGAQQWEHLANMQPLVSALAQASADRDDLLAQQRATLEATWAAVRTERIEHLRTSAENRCNALLSDDLASLEARQRIEQEQLDNISKTLADFLRACVAKTRQRSQQLIADMGAAADRASRVEERTGQKRDRNTVTVSDSIWYLPWTWFSSHQESYSSTSSYAYIAASDALENLDYYTHSARRQLLAAFDDLITPAAISAGLRRELLRAIDPKRPGFNPKELRALIETSLSGIKLPVFDFAAPDVAPLFAGFSGEIKDPADMQRLRDKLASEVGAINAELIGKLQTAVKEVSSTLEHIAQHLQEQLTAHLEEEMVRLRAALADKERQIARLQGLIAAL